MTTMAKLQKMSTQSIAKMQALVEEELARRESRMKQLSEVRKYIETAAKQFGLAAEEVIDMFRFGKKTPAKKGAKRRGRPPSKKSAVKVAAKRRGRPPLSKSVAKVAKRATKKVASKKVVAKKTAGSSARSQAMKEAWARRKAAAAAAE
jgi:hypothetical protein